MKILLMAIIAIGLVGCGGDSTTYQTIESNISEPYEVPSGTAIIIDGSDDALVTQENQTITIDCGGSCGDITIGLPIESSN